MKKSPEEEKIWIDHQYFTEKWIERAERNDRTLDKADRFISLWIAFNGWMRGKFGESKSDHELLSKVKKLDKMENIFSRLKSECHNFSENLNELEKYDVVNMRFTDYRNKDKKYNGTFGSLIETIYQIRCNLFHGRKETYGKDFRLVCLAYDILSPLFKKYLKEYGYD